MSEEYYGQKFPNVAAIMVLLDEGEGCVEIPDSAASQQIEDYLAFVPFGMIIQYINSTQDEKPRPELMALHQYLLDTVPYYGGGPAGP